MRLNALLCIDNLLESLDKMIILDELLPFLTDIQCQDAKIVMAVVGRFLIFFSVCLLLFSVFSVSFMYFHFNLQLRLFSFELLHEKTNNMHRQKQRCRSAVQ